nr:uncharacterized protein LOC131798640 isoform X2 [Pocillopora verrucosa]
MKYLNNNRKPMQRMDGDSDDEAFIAIANELLEKCNLPGTISKLEECSDNFFVAVYRGLLGDDLPGIVENPISNEQHVLNCQTLIDSVASDILSVDLTHITGSSIVEGDKISIRNLLEIFAGLLEFFMEYDDDDASGDENDSNLLTSEHDVISGVLREEFGPSYEAVYGFRDRRGEIKREPPLSQQSSGGVMLDRNGEEKKQGTPATSSTRVSVVWDHENSTGFDADTSKLSDSKIEVVSDSTTELIRLGETMSDRLQPIGVERRPEARNQVPDSTLDISARSPMISVSYQHGSRLYRDDAFGGTLNGTRPLQDNAKPVMNNASALTSSKRPDLSGIREPGQSSVLGRDATSVEDELTQYTLTPTEVGNSPAVRDKDPEKPLTSFLSSSSTSASWPEQISPLEPFKDSSTREASSFDALGVRPKQKPPASSGSEAGDNSGRSTPVYHHYHHHFHHTQPQGTVPEFQSVAGVSAAASVDAPGETTSLSRTKPTGTVPGTRPCPRTTDRLTRTVPGIYTHPHSGLSQPSATTVTGTTSTLTDSVFLSGSGSSRPRFVMATSSDIPADSSSGKAALQGRPAVSLATSTATSTTGLSTPVLSSLPPTSNRSYSALKERVSLPEQTDEPTDRLSSLRRKQPLASSLPARLQKASKSSEHPALRSTAAELLQKYTTPDDESGESDSEREADDEELDYGRLEPPAAKPTTRDFSTSRSSGSATRTSTRPRMPRSYKESTEEDSSPERAPRRGVTFRDTVETFPVSGRMDRLRRLLYEESEKERKRHTETMRKTYRDQLREIQQEKKKEKTLHMKRKLPLSPKVPKKKPKKKSPIQKRGRLEAVYCSQTRKSRPVRRTLTTEKGRKRSASASPVLGRRKSDSPDHPDMLLPAMLEEFPFLHVSPQTAHSMWDKQARHLSSFLKSGADANRTKTQRMIEEAEKRQKALVGILRKDVEHNMRMRDKQERQQQQRTVKAKLREKRQVSARARRYYDEYELRMRARMLKRRTREEQIFKRLFEDGLEIQKQRIRELREYAKEKRETLAQRQQNEIESLENFYRDQFAMLADGIARERYEMEVREKAQEKVVRQMRRELRRKFEHDVQEFQENLQRDEDSAYFRQLEADRLRGKFQLATRNAFY